MCGDTLIVAARDENYDVVFLDMLCWYPVRIDDRRRKGLKWIAAYQGKPVSAITSYAKILKIEPYLETGRFKVIFAPPIDLPNSVVLGERASGAIQGHRYTMLDKLKSASEISDLKPWN